MKQLKIKPKEQKGEFLGILLGTLAASLLVRALACKEFIRAGEEAVAKSRGQGMIEAVEVRIRVGQD